MNFLAVDTSYERLSVAVYRGGEVFSHTENEAMRHSVLLMDGIDEALSKAGLTLGELDFLACTVGPGSFTGVRIGIAAVKGMCFAANLPALSVTSFDTLAYADRNGKRLALIDAGHGNFYACPYENDIALEPKFLGEEEVKVLIEKGYRPISNETCDRTKGLVTAAEVLHKNAAPAQELTALYLRKSAAEEGRK